MSSRKAILKPAFFVLFAVALMVTALPSIAESFIVRDGVVVEPARGVVYLMESENVTARSLDNGDEIWSQPLTAQPLGLNGNTQQLVVLAESPRPETVRVLFLNIADGQREAEILGQLPKGIDAFIDQRPGRTFQASSTTVNGEVFLFWSYSGRPLRGAARDLTVRAPRLDGEEAAAPAPGKNETVRQGAFRLNPVALTATPVTDLESIQAPRFVPDLQPNETLANIPGRQFRSADDRYVLASEKVADARTWDRYRWTIYERGSNVRLGEVREWRSTAPFFVVGSTLVSESAPFMRRLPSGETEENYLALRAVSLVNGREIWRVELRDTTYRGVFPP